MASRDHKKQRREQKRRDKRIALRRAEQGGSPYRRVGTYGEVAACHITRNWREVGLATVSILRRVPGGGHALAVFLVDVWCLGLKDAFGRLDFPFEAFNEHLARAARNGAEMVPADLGSARRLVAGGIRWAREHNFRLPPRYERWVALLGEMGDVSTADVSEFGVDGKLRYVGEFDDLRRRLTGSSLEDFMSRDDVEVVGGFAGLPGLAGLSGLEGLEPGEPARLEASDGESAPALAQLGTDDDREATDVVRQWCDANGIAPHPRLQEAVHVLLDNLEQVPGPRLEGIWQPEGGTGLFDMQSLLSPGSDDAEPELKAALAQLSGFVARFNDPDELLAGLGFPPEPR